MRNKRKNKNIEKSEPVEHPERNIKELKFNSTQNLFSKELLTKLKEEINYD